MCSEVLITRKKILKYSFILYPSLYQIDRDTKTVYKNKHQQKSMLISKCQKIDQRRDINCRETTICQKTKGQNTKHVHFSMCMSLYKSVNATLFVYGFYKIGPLNDRFFLPIAVHNQYWEGTLQHTNIQIHKQENKTKKNVSSDVISQNTIQDEQITTIK